MIFSEPLSQYEEILKDAIRTSMKESGAKLAKTFQTLLIEILTLYMILPRKINFTQMARYGKHGEQTYRHCHRPMLYQQGWEENSSYRTVLVGMCRGSEARTWNHGHRLTGCCQQQMYDATCPSDNRELRAEDEEQYTRWIFAFNASFASMNAAKVFMKDNLTNYWYKVVWL